MQPRPRQANVKWFSTRQKGKRRKPSPMQLIGLRMNDLAKLFRARYGHVLPDDDAGRDDLLVAVHHLACLAHPRRHIAKWIEIWAPWLTVREEAEIVGDALRNPQRWKADALAWRLRLNRTDRESLGITTIGAIDENKAARAKRRRERDRLRKAAARRAMGAKPRKLYESQSVSDAKPWITEGISRAKWYRRRRAMRQSETSPATA